MKFKCKPAETWGEYEERIKKWHRWFAWYPVRLNCSARECAWLEVVERRGRAEKIESWSDGVDIIWEYRDEAVKAR